MVYGSSGSGTTRIFETKYEYVVFHRDSTEFNEQNFVDLLQLEKVEIDQLENKTFILDDAAAFKQLKTKVEEEI